eukprot:scaffold591_cov176-Amphora_coffeaeformis.AAC.3
MTTFWVTPTIQILPFLNQPLDCRSQMVALKMGRVMGQSPRRCRIWVARSSVARACSLSDVSCFSSWINSACSSWTWRSILVMIPSLFP